MRVEARNVEYSQFGSKIQSCKAIVTLGSSESTSTLWNKLRGRRKHILDAKHVHAYRMLIYFVAKSRIVFLLTRCKQYTTLVC